MKSKQKFGFVPLNYTEEKFRFKSNNILEQNILIFCMLKHNSIKGELSYKDDPSEVNSENHFFPYV